MISNLKKVIAGSFVFLTLFTANAVFNTTLTAQERFLVQEFEIPQWEISKGSSVEAVGEHSWGWQCELEFPDRQKEIDDTLVQNSLYTFDYFYGQGQLFVQVPECVKSFSLFVNHELVNYNLESGKSYKIDFSKLAKNGKNILQVSSVRFAEDENAKIKVYIPYPNLIPGDLQKEGFDPDVLALISEIIQSDVEHGFPNAQLAIAKNGRLVYQNAWGWLNSYDKFGNPLPIEDRTKITNDTLFDVASCTKALAANFALEYLISNNQLSLDDKVADILGKEFYTKTLNIKYTRGTKSSFAQNKKWKSELTIRDLACHRGGFPACPAYYNPFFNSKTQGRDPENRKLKNKLYSGSNADEQSRKKTYEAICKTPLMYEPRTKVLYSDVDYMILCFVVEKITGCPFDEFCRKTFWEPLELQRTAFYPLQNGFSKEDCAATELFGNTRGGFWKDFTGRQETIQGEVHDEMAWYSMAGVSGHAGLFINAGDAVKLLQTMFYGGLGNAKFFSKDVIDTFFAPQTNKNPNWGIGWYRQGDGIRSWNFSQSASRNTVGHNGWTGTLIMLEPEQNLVLAYFTSKRNTPFSLENSSDFEGLYFTAANYGFVPQLLLEDSLNANGEDSNIKKSGENEKKRARLLLLEDMVHDKFRLVAEEKVKGELVTDANHPIVRAAYSILEVFIQRAIKDGSEEALALARNSLNYLVPDRDSAEIEKINSMLN